MYLPASICICLVRRHIYSPIARQYKTSFANFYWTVTVSYRIVLIFYRLYYVLSGYTRFNYAFFLSLFFSKHLFEILSAKFFLLEFIVLSKNLPRWGRLLITETWMQTFRLSFADLRLNNSAKFIWFKKAIKFEQYLFWYLQFFANVLLWKHYSNKYRNTFISISFYKKTKK